ncbi:MAG: RsmF rRNA methyltransferase first C-terminal domain-containing protein [Niabella sp.]
MAIIPQQLIDSLQGVPGFNEQAFIAVHNSDEPVTSIRLNPQKSESLLRFFEEKNVRTTRVPWAVDGYYLSQRPSFTFDPLFHAGCYYVQEASSMFLEQALKQSTDLSKPLKVLDLCAAPGGKSTHLQSLLSKESLLVSNEVIRQRANILKDNIIKWGCSNVVVTNNDPKDFTRLTGYFDVIVVDVPCSGSGLFRRDKDAITEWSENNVVLCNQRQQRILADVLPALKEGGILIYSTCSYSEKEDEVIADWLTDTFQIANLRFEIDSNWNITEMCTLQNNYGYRFWPHLVKGEGFFLSAFQKTEAASFKFKNTRATKSITKTTAPFVSKWVAAEAHELIGTHDKIYAWPQLLFNDIDLCVQQLRVIYSGTSLGELVRQKFIPDHALAMSMLLKKEIPKLQLNNADAIAYLQKKLNQLASENRGWNVACYHHFPLGWMNILPDRINNYYPKELRILKDFF